MHKIQAGDQASEDGFDCHAQLAAPEPGTPRPALEVGTLERPIPAQHTAVIRLTYVQLLAQRVQSVHVSARHDSVRQNFAYRVLVDR